MRYGDSIAPSPSSLSSPAETIQIAEFSQVLHDISLRCDVSSFVNVSCSVAPSNLHSASSPLSLLLQAWVCRGQGLTFDLHLAFPEEYVARWATMQFSEQVAHNLSNSEVKDISLTAFALMERSGLAKAEARSQGDGDINDERLPYTAARTTRHRHRPAQETKTDTVHKRHQAPCGRPCFLPAHHRSLRQVCSSTDQGRYMPFSILDLRTKRYLL